MNLDTLSIKKPSPTATDAYDGGLKAIRDTTGLSGGFRGNVNCVSYTYTIAGSDVKSFEWNSLSVLDNYATEGENCAAYIQANKHSTGPTWGLCVEACDTTPGDTTGLVTLELDQWVTGSDNGGRIGIDIVLGDSQTKRGLPRSVAVEGTDGIRIGSSNDAPYAKWTTGIKLLGNIGTGLDCSESTMIDAIKLNKNQKIIIGGTTFSESGLSVKTNPLIYVALILSIISIALKYIT